MVNTERFGGQGGALSTSLRFELRLAFKPCNLTLTLETLPPYQHLVSPNFSCAGIFLVIPTISFIVSAFKVSRLLDGTERRRAGGKPTAIQHSLDAP